LSYHINIVYIVRFLRKIVFHLFKLLELLRVKLSQKGYRVIEAHDGEEGLNLALREHPDFILLDVIMPKVDGLTMLQKLRQDEWGKNAPVLVLSNLSTTEAIKSSQASGACDYLIKIDYTLDELAEIIKKKLEEFAAKNKSLFDLR